MNEKKNHLQLLFLVADKLIRWLLLPPHHITVCVITACVWKSTWRDWPIQVFSLQWEMLRKIIMNSNSERGKSFSVCSKNRKVIFSIRSLSLQKKVENISWKVLDWKKLWQCQLTDITATKLNRIYISVMLIYKYIYSIHSFEGICIAVDTHYITVINAAINNKSCFLAK